MLEAIVRIKCYDYLNRDTEDRDSAVRDILSLEMVTRFEAEESPVLPDTQEAAIRYIS